MAVMDQEPATRRVQTVCLLILTFIASGVALAVLKPVIVPFVLALLLAYCLSPVIDVQVARLRLPRPVAIVSTALLALVLLGLIGFFVAASIGQMSSGIGRYQQQLDAFTAHMAEIIPFEQLGIQRDPETDQVLHVPERAVGSFISAVLSETTALVSNGLVVVIFVMFILAGRRPRPLSPANLLDEVEVRIRRYLLQVVFFSALTGLLVGVILGVIGVDFFWVFAFLAFLLNFIPSVGSIIATLLPLPVVLLSPELSPVAKVLAIALPATVQFVIGNVVQPRVQGNALELHPVTILLGLIFFGMIWGVVGAFLATPLTAVMKIILERIPVTRGLGRLLAGDVEGMQRPQHSPVRTTL